jgi:hypothetical protein
MSKKFWLILPLVFAMAVFLTVDPLGKKTRAGLKVEYSSGDAAVFLNDQYLDQAPTTQNDLQAGTYILKIQPSDKELASFSTPITLTEGTLTVLVYNPGQTPQQSSSTLFELSPLSEEQKKVSVIAFETIPENAFISLDDAENEFSPLEKTLDPGDHHFAITLPSYDAQEHSIQLIPGYKTLVSVSLAKSSEALTENTPASESALIQQRVNQGVSEATESSLIVGPKVQILHTDYFVGTQEVLKVRDAATSSAQEIGYAKVNYFYPYVSEKVDSTQNPAEQEKWYQIQFHDQAAWINAKYAKLLEK